MLLDRKTPPSFNRSISFDLISPVRQTLPNGLEVYFISGSAQDVVKIDLVIKAGRWFEKQWGLSYFAANLLTKGTAHKTSFEIAQIFDRYGAHLEVSPGLDVVTISLYALNINLEPVLALLHEILTSPAFPEKELQQSKAIYLQNLKVNQEKTSFLASKLIRKNIFGEQHPYGKELEETEINALTADQLSDFYAHFFFDYQVIVSGKIDDHTQHLITKVLSSLKKTSVNEVVTKSVSPGMQKQLADKAGSVQVSVRMGKRSLLRADPDYFHVLFLNHILGGYFGSRLMRNIREEKGLTYGIHASLHAMKYDSYLVIGADVNKENTELIFQEIRNELRLLRTEPISEEELDTARFHFIGSLQGEITTPFAHAEKIKNILLNNLDQAYYKRMIHTISQATAEVLLKKAAQHFHEETFFEAAVG